MTTKIASAAYRAAPQRGWFWFITSTTNGPTINNRRMLMRLGQLSDFQGLIRSLTTMSCPRLAEFPGCDYNGL